MTGAADIKVIYLLLGLNISEYYLRYLNRYLALLEKLHGRVSIWKIIQFSYVSLHGVTFILGF